jgi:plastocyanin
MSFSRAGKRLPVFAALLAAAAVLAVFACANKDTTAPPYQPPAECAVAGHPAPGATEVFVAMRGFAFSPDTVRISAGTTVTWVNCEQPTIDPHTSTAAAGEWDSGYLKPGAKYSHAFAAAGKFAYACIPHPFMRGAVIVQ